MCVMDIMNVLRTGMDVSISRSHIIKMYGYVTWIHIWLCNKTKQNKTLSLSLSLSHTHTYLSQSNVLLYLGDVRYNSAVADALAEVLRVMIYHGLKDAEVA